MVRTKIDRIQRGIMLFEHPFQTRMDGFEILKGQDPPPNSGLICDDHQSSPRCPEASQGLAHPRQELQFGRRLQIAGIIVQCAVAIQKDGEAFKYPMSCRACCMSWRPAFPDGLTPYTSHQ